MICEKWQGIFDKAGFDECGFHPRASFNDDLRIIIDALHSDLHSADAFRVSIEKTKSEESKVVTLKIIEKVHGRDLSYDLVLKPIEVDLSEVCETLKAMLIEKDRALKENSTIIAELQKALESAESSKFCLIHLFFERLLTV